MFYRLKTRRYVRYSSRLSLHSRVPFTRVFINFIRAISLRSRVTARESYLVRCCYTRVILRAMHSSHTLSATRESDMACCTRVRPRALHASHCM